MGRTEVNAVIIGPQAEREFTFLVDTGATFVGLPADDIENLGLIPIPDGRRQFVTANGVVERDTYSAYGRLEEQGFLATVMVAPIPLIGYELLENMRFRVNPITQSLERVGDEEMGPPYML
ncbi:MAG: aspartyl protease family protein [Chloroflexi bacterium]|nr:aspartyl protease family protein [Chloroflexota bacterium]